MCIVFSALLIVFAFDTAEAGKKRRAKAVGSSNFFLQLFSSSTPRYKKRRLKRQKVRYKKRYNRRKLKKRRVRRKVRTVPAPVWAKSVPDGPVQMIVSLPEQRVRVYKNGEMVTSSPVSTGKKGYSTPAGVFSILQRKKRHYSNLYDSAPMPYMQRLTWSGIALHGSGHVPRYPASHGCVRLPHKFARDLFRFSRRGAHVVVTDHNAAPVDIEHANLFQPMALEDPANEPEGVAKLIPASASVALRGSQGEASSAILVAAMKQAEIETRDTPPVKKVKRSSAPLRILIAPRTGPERIKDIQKMLVRLGFDPGPIDGVAGRATRAAIKEFEEYARMPVTGMTTEQLVTALYREAGIGEVPTGRIYVRQSFREIFDAPVSIADEDMPIGTHLFTAKHFVKDAKQVNWMAVTLKAASDSHGELLGGEETATKEDAPVADPAPALAALSRVQIPDDIRQRISRLLTPGTSLVISDQGMSRETGPGTDFVVLTK